MLNNLKYVNNLQVSMNNGADIDIINSIKFQCQIQNNIVKDKMPCVVNVVSLIL